jgi:cyclopropane fatty-acyl-phospholipid synthase-like methyltransferase
MPTPTWFPDELAHAGSEHLDETYAPGYDAKSQTNPDEDIAPLLALGLNHEQTLVDLGAGTGTFALAAAPHCKRVVAVDVSREMLRALEAKIAGAGIRNIETVQAGFLSYAHHGEPVDVVYSRHALHHLPDFWKAIALTRIAAMLKPGGVFFLRDLVYSFDPAEAEGIIETWLARATTDPSAGWTREELETHLRDEFSPFSWVLEPILERAGFEIRDAVHRGGFYAAYTCIRSNPAGSP